jgi:ABC-2 type transport system ATP-binding protein
MTKAIEAKDLSKRFVVTTGGLFKREVKDVWAVKDISLAIEAGQSVAFIGPNGAGKSTTIKMLTGILEPTSGTASILGLTPWKERTRLAMSIGAVFGQRSQLWYHLPPADTFDLLAKIYGLDGKTYRARRQLLIEKFNLAPILSTQVRKLSLGQRMKAEIAASLLHSPRILFLDEPTIGLDVVARMELRELIRNWNTEDGLTILLTSHDAGDIEAVAERVIIVNHGQVVLDDTVGNMRRDFLGTKILEVKFHDSVPSIDLGGVAVIERSDYVLKLEVDTSRTPIQKVMNDVVRTSNVADITIEDPPLESIIAHIYGSHQAQTQGAYENPR